MAELIDSAHDLVLDDDDKKDRDGPRYLTPVQRHNIIAWWLQKRPIAEICQEVQKSKKTIYAVIRKTKKVIETDPQVKKRARKVLTQEKMEQIKHHFETRQDASTRNSSAELKISKSSIQRALKEMGMPTSKMAHHPHHHQQHHHHHNIPQSTV